MVLHPGLSLAQRKREMIAAMAMKKDRGTG
jgi:hypothetical protein